MSIRTTKIQKVRRRIRDSIRIAQKRGYKITAGETLNQEKSCCCPLAAVYIAHNRLHPRSDTGLTPDKDTNVLRNAAKLLGLTSRQASQFICAFDDRSNEARTEIAHFGQELRNEID